MFRIHTPVCITCETCTLQVFYICNTSVCITYVICINTTHVLQFLGVQQSERPYKGATVLYWRGVGNCFFLGGGGGEVECFLDQEGEGLIFFQTLMGGWIFVNASLANILINIIKRLFSWKTIDFVYIKNMSSVGYFFLVHLRWVGGILFAQMWKGDCNFFRVTYQIFPIPPPPSILNGRSLTRNGQQYMYRYSPFNIFPLK